MITAIILAKNEEKMLQPCINSVKQIAGEIVVIDNGSNDRTAEIAMQNSAKVFLSNEKSFAHLRNLGLQNATGEWVIYVDADERVTKELADEINGITSGQVSKVYEGYIINREDYYFGSKRPLFSPMHRLFKRASLKSWQGEVHETPVLEGLISTLRNPLLHFTHIDMNSMLINTISWSDKEAKLRFESGHPPVVWWRLIRVFLTGFWNSFVTQQGYKNGTSGWVEAMYQGCSLFITYAKLWEMQNRETISSAYQNLDKPYSN
ncbi:MAG: glycosyltransferase family 2 protein [bacterium]|nr:glycosyltransferase family 2 protein [bacterium]